MSKYVAYYRVSTTRQGQSGLGLDAQRAGVREFLATRGWPPLAEFTEIESGRKSFRPELEKAFRACRMHGATLVIAKLDRLARNAAFLLSLKDAGVDFVATDLPDANRLTVGIMALVAEDEADRISQRTRAALAQAKRRGVKLGNPANLSNQSVGTLNSVKTRAARADRYCMDAITLIDEVKADGFKTVSAIAKELTRRRVPTPRGQSGWSPMQVKRIEDRARKLRSVVSA